MEIGRERVKSHADSPGDALCAEQIINIQIVKGVGTVANSRCTTTQVLPEVGSRY